MFVFPRSVVIDSFFDDGYGIKVLTQFQANTNRNAQTQTQSGLELWAIISGVQVKRWWLSMVVVGWLGMRDG